MTIQNNGTAVEGTYIFSAYDLDIPAFKDAGVPGVTMHVDGKRGFGEHSEGINLLAGMDTSTLKYAKRYSFLRDITSSNYHIRGSRLDASTELSEFLVKADAENAKFQWTGDENCITQIFSYYQPQVVTIRKVVSAPHVVTVKKVIYAI